MVFMLGKPTKHYRYDLDRIKAAACGHWAEIIQKVGTLSCDYLSGKHSPCPVHGGKDKFRVFDDFDTTGGAVCNDCGKMADGFSFLKSLLQCTFSESLELIAKHLGIEPDVRRNPKKEMQTDPAKHLKLQGRPEQMALLWGSLYKPSIIPAALWNRGVEYATYRKQNYVFAIPIYGQIGEPVGYCLYHATGKLLPAFSKGQREPTGWRKVKITSGSKPGWMGPLPKSTEKVVWKTEGPSCGLALYSLGLPEGHTVCCNAFGAEENPATNPWMLERFRSVDEVIVVHDCDKPGQRGATEVSSPNGKSAT